ncbi:MAG: hypothetical protein ABIK43_03380 [candidate division WOR-3 bacterium]
MTEHKSDVRARLFQEIDSLIAANRNLNTAGSKPSPPSLWEPLDTRGLLVRVNLLPIMNDPGQLEKLASVVAESALRVTGNPILMADRMASAEQWSRERAPHLAPTINQIAAKAATEGYPQIHHSAAYRRCYQPAYRVVLAELWQD